MMKLTKNDKLILKAFERNRFINICRNKNGDLIFISGEPYNHNGFWYPSTNYLEDESCLLYLNNDMFSFITFDNSPWSEEDLLKLEIEE